MRRSLVLTDEQARHPFRAALPPHVRRRIRGLMVRPQWLLSRDDVQGFASTYFACLAAAIVFLA